MLRRKEPDSVVTSTVAVMERAKNVITPFSSDINLEAVSIEIGRLSRQSASLLGIESHAKDSIDIKINELQAKQRIAEAYSRFGGVKLQLSSEVLTWRKPELAYALGKFAIPLPEVALFGLERSITWLRSSWPYVEVEVDPALPPSLRGLYRDVSQALETAASSNDSFHSGSIAIIAAFSGVIPAETKAKISDAKASMAFTDIRVLAEADWTVDVQPAPYYTDPIVVGLVEDQMWVIDVFDPTPLEDYIAREFTT